MQAAYAVPNERTGHGHGRELFDEVFQSILAADVTRDIVQDCETRRNAFLDLLLEISAPGPAEADLDLLCVAA